MPVRVLLWRSIGWFASAVFCLALYVYPSSQPLLPSYLAVYAVLLYHRPERLLLLLPASLALLDLAPQTGWFFLEEIDLLLLLSVAICYLRLARWNVTPVALPRLLRWGLYWMSLALFVGFWRGLQPWSVPDVYALNDYLSPFNALRVGKAWLWAAALLAPLRRLASLDEVRFDAWLVTGMLGGLATVALCATYERYLFPGLLNLSSDYRITAPFSAMHTGGAALDGYFAMTLPLLLVWLSDGTRRWHQPAALLLLPLAWYASLATFSRGLYLALASSVLIMLWQWRPAARYTAATAVQLTRRYHWRHLVLPGIVGAEVILLQQTFLVSGYRGMLAATIMVLAAMALRPQQQSAASTLGGALLGMVTVALLAQLWTFSNSIWPVFKPPYLVFLLALAIYALARQYRPSAAALLLGSLCGASGWISLHYAGMQAIPVSLEQMGVCLLLITWAIWRWRTAPAGVLNLAQQREPGVPLPDTGLMIAVLVLAATVIPFYNGYFVGERFASSRQDLGARYRHWQDVLQVMRTQPDAGLLGAGLGRFPALYAWFNQRAEMPPHASFAQHEGRRYLELYAGHYQQGYGELLRVLQRVALRPQQAYQLSVDVSGRAAPGFLIIRLCARQLLYPASCISLTQQAVPPDQAWQTHIFHFNSGMLGSELQPIQLELAADGDGASVGVDNVSLIELDSQRELLRNGSFAQLHTYWFFSSDHHHLPWHIKSFWLNLYFELGIAGVIAYTLLLGSALHSLLMRARLTGRCASALALLASIVAFQIVGLFDSLIDVPRIALLSHLVLVTVVIARPTAVGTGQPLHGRNHHVATSH